MKGGMLMKQVSILLHSGKETDCISLYSYRCFDNFLYKSTIAASVKAAIV